ncbi:hypothetical protein DY000_02010986 [Brassica cretica]|nr:hypothetical protein DY000_02010986 [Brassica cretica]
MFPDGRTVCKVDAAWNATSGACGIGGIFSGDNTRNLSTVSEAHSHVSSALMAEAIAVHRAVVLTVYSNVRSLTVLFDSLSLIKLLKRGGTQPELFDIYHFMTMFDVISFDFISRIFNAEADSVAKSALAMSVTNSIHGVGGFRVSGDPSDEAGMVENFGDGERRETFQFHLQYCDLIRVATHPHALHQLHLLLRDNKIRRSLRAPISMSDVLSTTNPPRNRFTSTLGESLVYDKEEARELFV